MGVFVCIGLNYLSFNNKKTCHLQLKSYCVKFCAIFAVFKGGTNLGHSILNQLSILMAAIKST